MNSKGNWWYENGHFLSCHQVVSCYTTGFRMRRCWAGIIVKSSPADFIFEQVKKLGRKEREAFLSLSYVNFPSNLDRRVYPEEVALAIFKSNSVAAGGTVGIFPRMARLNHACSSAFNAVYSWREEEETLFIYALRNISKGDVGKLHCWLFFFW